MKPSLHITSIVLAGAWAFASCGPSPAPQNPSEDLSAIPTRDSSRQSAREAPKKEPGLELIVFPQSIRIRNDSLYFRYGLRNHTDTSFTVYNLGYIGYIWHWQSFSYLPNMGVILLLYDQKHQIRFNARGSSLRFRDPTRPPSFEEYRYTHYLDKYIVLSPGETIEYDWQEYLGDFDLEKGSYSFQLRYVVPAPTDNKYNPLNRYEKAWRKNPRLKNTALFRSELNSRFYSFHLSKDIKRG